MSLTSWLKRGKDKDKEKEKDSEKQSSPSGSDSDSQSSSLKPSAAKAKEKDGKSKDTKDKDADKSKDKEKEKAKTKDKDKEKISGKEPVKDKDKVKNGDKDKDKDRSSDSKPSKGKASDASSTSSSTQFKPKTVVPGKHLAIKEKDSEKSKSKSKSTKSGSLDGDSDDGDDNTDGSNEDSEDDSKRRPLKKDVKGALSSSRSKKSVDGDEKKDLDEKSITPDEEIAAWIAMKLDLKNNEKGTALLAEDAVDEDAEKDKDEFRRKNRAASKSTVLPKEQQLLWAKFRVSLPIPVKNIVSAGACIALRKSLCNTKVLVHGGIPAHLRRSVWEMASLARVYPERLEHIARYQYYLGLPAIPAVQKEIERDCSRAMRGHAKFLTKSGQKELNNVLVALSLHSPAIGYCNSMVHIGAFLLLFYPQERAFWMLCSLVDNVLPVDYFTNSLLGVRADCQLIKILLYLRMPKLFAHLTDQSVHVEVYCLRWLMSLFIITLPFPTCVRIFDLMILEASCNARAGSVVLIQVALAIFVLKRQELMALEGENLVEFLNTFETGNKNHSIDGVELIQTALSAKCKLTQEDLERRDSEKKIMEIEYMKELQFSLKYKRQEEQRRQKEEEEEKKKKGKELESLQWGTTMWKIGHTGKPKQCQIMLLKEEKRDAQGLDQYYVTWDSKKKSKAETVMKLRECALFFGLNHGLFTKRPEIAKQFSTQSHLAFSLINYDRSLDLVCMSVVDFDQWYDAMQAVNIKEMEKIDRLAIQAAVRNKERKEKEAKEAREAAKLKEKEKDKDKEKGKPDKEKKKKKKEEDEDEDIKEDDD